MNRILVLLFLLLPFQSIAQSKAFSLHLGVLGGPSLMNAAIQEDNFYFGNINAAIGINGGLHYNLDKHWQIGLLAYFTQLNISKSKSEASLIEHYSSSGNLSRASGGGVVDLFGCGLEMKRIFYHSKWQLSPFVRLNTYLTNSFSGNMSVYLKRPNEHYFQSTEWVNNSDTALAIRFSPIKLGFGLQISHNINNRISLYGSVQYMPGAMHLAFAKRQNDFYGQKSVTQEDYKQRFRYIALELGINFYFKKSF